MRTPAALHHNHVKLPYEPHTAHAHAQLLRKVQTGIPLLREGEGCAELSDCGQETVAFPEKNLPKGQKCCWYFKEQKKSGE